MVWAIQVDGVDDRLTPASNVFESTETYTKLSIITELNPTDLYASAENFFEAVNIFEVNYRSFVNDEFKLRVRFGTTAGATYLYIPAGIPTGVFTTLECTAEEVGADVQISIKVGGVEVSSHTQVNSTLTHVTRTGTIFNAAASSQFKYLQVYKDDVLTFDWDATASSHAAGTPVLTDTISGNNATGVNMPTDGSAWIDLGGGGGTIEESITFASESDLLSLNNITISANVSIASISGIAPNNNTDIQEIVNLISHPHISSSVVSSINESITISGQSDISSSNISEMIESVLLSGQSSVITSLGNIINESLVLSTSSDLGVIANIELSGEISLGSSSDLIVGNSIEFNGDISLTSQAAVSVITQALYESSIEMGTISELSTVGNIAVFGVETPDNRKFKIAVSSRDFKVAVSSREFKITSTDRIYKIDD